MPNEGKQKHTNNKNPGKSKLTGKQEKFCREYLIDLNLTQAAIRAGYSKKTAYAIGSENLRKPQIQEFLRGFRKNISEKNDNLSQKVIDELVRIGFSNVQDFITDGNTIRDISQIDRQTASPVASVKKSVTTFGEDGHKEVVEFKLWDKVGALEKLGRHLGIFELDNKQKNAVINVNVTDDDDG